MPLVVSTGVLRVAWPVATQELVNAMETAGVYGLPSPSTRLAVTVVEPPADIDVEANSRVPAVNDPPSILPI